MAAEAFPRKFGKYYLLSPLAQGGMGALYMAMAGERDLEKLCVIKTVLPHLADSEYVARFRDEAKVVVRLSHGNLVPVFDAGQVHREIFLAMDFVEGKDLRAVWNRCAKKGIAFPLDVATYIVKELCRGLHYAHTFGDLKLVHRDVSPPNVLLSYTGEIKLTDFGLASSTLKLEKTSPGVIYGKVSYMSPEQARGEGLDGRTDLYAAGIILWELLTGRQLFPAGEAQATDLLQRARDPKPEPPSKRAARVPPGLDAIVLKALSVNRDDRYQSGEEMRAALAGWLAAEAPQTDSARVSAFMDQLFAEDKPGERSARDGLVAKVRDSFRTQPAMALGDELTAPAESLRRRAADRAGEMPRRRADDAANAATLPAGAKAQPGAAGARAERVGTDPGGPTFRAVEVPAPGPPGAPTHVNMQMRGGTEGSAAIKRAPAEDELSGVVGTIVDGRYSVLRLIGEGGMGRVYEAEHVEIGKRVALKILHPVYSRTPEVVERFRREARAASRIGHPNIVDVTDSGQTKDGSVYFAMEMLEGIELAAVIDREGALPPARALPIAQQMCRALKAAHDVGIIHRDLKPENIFLVVRDGTADFVKVLDFGIAKVADLEEPRTGRLTHPGMAMGTPEYMAPEQAAGKPADPRSDVYAVGAIIYEMLTGAPPYQGENFMEILSKKASQDPRPLREFNKELPEQVEQVVLRAMARDPGARPQTMDALEYDLTKCFAGRGLAVARLLGLPGFDEGPGTSPSGITSLAALQQQAAAGLAAAPAQSSMQTTAPVTNAQGIQTSQPTEEIWKQPRGARGWLVALLLLVGAGAGGFYFYQKWRDKKESQRLAAAVNAGSQAGSGEVSPIASPEASPGVSSSPSGKGKHPSPSPSVAGTSPGPDPTLAASPSPSPSPGGGDDDPDPPSSKGDRDRERDRAEAKKLLQMARAAEARMEWSEAREAYERLLDTGKIKGAALTGLASVAWQTKDLPRTIDLAKQAIKAGGGNKARMLLGHAYFKQRDFAAAVQAYQEVLKLDPEHREAQTALKAAKRQGGIP